ncbi:hypothetical protein STIUS_v1c01190 [Spiroplasma sp. TIUS-1]|uniref:hypothetical protein n=1 Tax=Spiroplasma sp. TIUS-1 TaxID=216963 RepID=UPI0013978100|nr:hypothetical protein [Spiroplasma sp. TIUS-1]QHX35674.1 hypothetical protein STIUS_v1c01190 [Spiroplasma sp. TIUS-1]
MRNRKKSKGKSTLFVDIISLGITSKLRKRKRHGHVKKLRYEVHESGKFKNHNKKYDG